MMRRFVLLSAFFLLVAASWVATGEGSLEPMDPSEPMDWCVPTDVCVVEEAGRREAVFQFEADVDTGLGTFPYSDHGVCGKRAKSVLELATTRRPIGWTLA
jgi:hypothetical protein